MIESRWSHSNNNNEEEEDEDQSSDDEFVIIPTEEQRQEGDQEDGSHQHMPISQWIRNHSRTKPLKLFVSKVKEMEKKWKDFKLFKSKQAKQADDDDEEEEEEEKEEKEEVTELFGNFVLPGAIYLLHPCIADSQAYECYESLKSQLTNVCETK